MKKYIVTALAFATTVTITLAQDITPIKLYPAGVPNSKPHPLITKSKTRRTGPLR